MPDQYSLRVPVFDLALCISQAVDLISPLVADHHKRTCQIAYGLGAQMHLSPGELKDLVLASALHDIGGLTREDRLGALEFEYKNPFGHSISGYLLLSTFSPFSRIANIVRFHHVAWENGAGTYFSGITVPVLSYLLQLADRVAVLIDTSKPVLSQVDYIIMKVKTLSGERFIPEHVNILEQLASREAFWLDAVNMKDINNLSRKLDWDVLDVSSAGFLGLVNLFRRIVDFRSPFTSTHSAGVAATASELATLAGFKGQDRWYIHLSGLLHDLGKLAVPAEILEKKSGLTREEVDIMRQHTYYTNQILEPLKILDMVRIWGAYHHERIDGKGYPFHFKEDELPVGSRIVAVADIFTALSEDRPYRNGMGFKESAEIISQLANEKKLDADIVHLLTANMDAINKARVAAQVNAKQEYNEFIRKARELTPAAGIIEDYF